MSCCGEQRARLRSDAAGARNLAAASATPNAGAAPIPPTRTGDVMLRYVGRGPLALRGPRTGRVYRVVAGDSVVHVHPDDADALRRTRLFTIAV